MIRALVLPFLGALSIALLACGSGCTETRSSVGGSGAYEAALQSCDPDLGCPDAGGGDGGDPLGTTMFTFTTENRATAPTSIHTVVRVNGSVLLDRTMMLDDRSTAPLGTSVPIRVGSRIIISANVTGSTQVGEFGMTAGDVEMNCYSRAETTGGLVFTSAGCIRK